MLRPIDQWDLTSYRERGLGRELIGTASAATHAAHAAHDADERATGGAWVAFGRALLVTAGAADHRIPLLELSHQYSPTGLGKHSHEADEQHPAVATV